VEESTVIPARLQGEVEKLGHSLRELNTAVQVSKLACRIAASGEREPPSRIPSLAGRSAFRIRASRGGDGLPIHQCGRPPI